ncbi:MAG: alpha-L-glutamate ligase-like protein [Magnetococcales bacterium]|nr:alpha-L-glutamate ligase-like protein [Magnetococcales bacterium]
MFSLIRQLKEKGVLGLNARNGAYILPHNPRRLYPLVDDKLRTKKLAVAAGVAVPELYGVVETPHQAGEILQTLEKYSDFVIKPTHGSGGDGILVIVGRTKKGFRSANGTLVTKEEIAFHINNTLSGIYSLGGQPDVALVEYRVKFDPVFEDITFNGVPDIRIIVFYGIPVMAMVRLPTRSSSGKANLHQGAIGVGIDMASGTTLKAVYKNDITEEHPDTGNPVMGVVIPHWKKLLTIAANSFELTGLPYQGIDIVLDRDLGPLVLELNARPGLGIQIANRTGLGKRLQKVEQYRREINSLEERVAFSQEHFSVL